MLELAKDRDVIVRTVIALFLADNFKNLQLAYQRILDDFKKDYLVLDMLKKYVLSSLSKSI